MKTNKSGSRTLFMSVLMSSPGPIVVGIGLFMGRSSTQLADFIRRSAELAAIVVSYIVYKMTNREVSASTSPCNSTSLTQDCISVKKTVLERRCNLTVGAAMCLSGAAMLLISFFSENTEKGNVIPGLVIAILGVIANTLFWIKYTHLRKETGNPILTVQSRLYRAKSLVDICVTVALTTVALFPGSAAAYYLDIIGSVIVALYLIKCGIQTVREYY